MSHDQSNALVSILDQRIDNACVLLKTDPQEAIRLLQQIVVDEKSTLAPTQRLKALVVLGRGYIEIKSSEDALTEF